MEFNCTLFNIQHIKKLDFSVDLSKNQLMCIVGKNGVGKTTLIRAIKNIKFADTFTKTASPYIFKQDSQILYTIDGKEYNFQYSSKLQVIDTKSIVSDEIKKNIHAELPIPHGERFNHFQRLAEIDEELRKSISLQEYSTPDELISFLSKIYKSPRFDKLKEIHVKGKSYYFILKEDNFYIREDYLSSGEHFIISLYKIIQRQCKFIVIDEIDISLDASAQVNLITELRDFCKKYQVNIIFTTHSLALMKTLDDTELYYMENNEAVVSFKNVSYNYIKSELFCFHGWDKYILTEDKILKDYLTHLISQCKNSIFFKYKIIYIGTAQSVVNLMTRNESEHFLASAENVISILDGDQKIYSYCKKNPNIFFIPFESIEKQLTAHYDSKDRDGLPFVEDSYKGTKESDRGKKLYENYIDQEIMTGIEIFSFINERKNNDVKEFKSKLINFLNKKSANLQ